MHAIRTTAEIKSEDLAGLLATSAGADRVTTRMPAVTLEQLLTVETAPPTPPYGYEVPVIPAATGTSLEEPPYRRIVVIAVSAAVTLISVLGIATVI